MTYWKRTSFMVKPYDFRNSLGSALFQGKDIAPYIIYYLLIFNRNSPIMGKIKLIYWRRLLR